MLKWPFLFVLMWSLGCSSSQGKNGNALSDIKLPPNSAVVKELDRDFSNRTYRLHIQGLLVSSGVPYSDILTHHHDQGDEELLAELAWRSGDSLIVQYAGLRSAGEYTEERYPFPMLMGPYGPEFSELLNAVFQDVSSGRQEQQTYLLFRIKSK